MVAVRRGLGRERLPDDGADADALARSEALARAPDGEETARVELGDVEHREEGPGELTREVELLARVLGYLGKLQNKKKKQ